ncbi:NAD-dependent succinate-semialdehyde dehydrogenase [Pasteurella multocida]|uniref:NAD-dependent succinate-semialdehyde dehydrogenase n=1 Tax=Pasteurella multocida TaxID=747 RepID=UPI002CF91B47|nr:NAD-dependent succinate-semialdehyde dehydrogenase [Pasteurella multocida]MEB3479102.1 NAD-dependent succinate-semialdehyde dehydrogenase [Pasteurella multocida]MEB3491890.1 NAD-dependent succinate-semialdehyde dehydrogenase [Pasteurella multocida]HDR0627781.1 NAD-dependent succinate-semialdehyde dehydrogenase [Pasteurella multocida]HDR1131707.1 NAD-dependent succinate-semialdehyde dehydrogenase [Pasteurella multocida]HDR1817082.1 NAD-dependent succinate-semialdehyde dehydrogenase [Pasteure
MQQFSLLKTKAYINGEYVQAKDHKTFAVTNPANQQIICELPDLSAEETEYAIVCATQAQKKWQKVTPKERANLLRRWYNLVIENQEELAQLLSLEQGKPISESRGEILYGASFIEWFAEEAKRIYGDVLPQDKENHRLLVIKQGIGVVAAITPWNFPNAMITRKAAPAFAAGCAMVLKPAQETPLSALALAELAHQAGLPAGLFNVITSTRSVEIGKVLTEHPTIRKVTFTGSTRVGKILMAQSASTVKKLSLELGGNAPSIVFDDADLENAIEGIIASKFRNSGQTCVCTNRIYVQAGIYDRFVEQFSAKVTAFKVGSANEAGVNIGPLISQSAVNKIQEHIDDATSKGATLVVGGKPHTRGGTFFEPTVLRDVTQSMLVAKDETFAPLAPVFKFDTEEQVIAMANDTEFGLASYVYTQDISRIWRVSEALEYGIVGINEGLISNEMAPFGGVKESGLGREGSRYGIDEFLEIKYLCLKV